MNNQALKATVIKHIDVEGLGCLEPILKKRGYTIDIYNAQDIDSLQKEAHWCDLLIALGGPMGVYEKEMYPYFDIEIKVLEERIKSGYPTLGICLGAELIAEAIGGTVYPGEYNERGWLDIAVTSEGKQTCLRHLDQAKTKIFQWHGDTYHLPEGVHNLATSTYYENQAFMVGQNVLAVQFHPEVTPQDLDQWFETYHDEIKRDPHISLHDLREGTKKYYPQLETQANVFWEEWLDQIQKTLTSKERRYAR